MSNWFVYGELGTKYHVHVALVFCSFVVKEGYAMPIMFMINELQFM